jgi:hypothetical protein
MSRYWERWAERAESKSATIRRETEGAGERVRRRAEARAEEAGAAPPGEDPGRRETLTEESDATWSRDPDDRIVP